MNKERAIPKKMNLIKLKICQINNFVKHLNKKIQVIRER